MIRVHPDAVTDLREIKQTDPAAAGQLVAFIQQLKADPSLKDKLLEHNFGADRAHEISVSKWISIYARVERLPVWRLKAWSMERQGLKYRLLYLYYWPDKTFWILGIAPRESIDYDDPSHPLRLRIVKRIRLDFADA